MFAKISWTHYLLVVIVVLVLYYLYVGIRYYVFDLKSLVNRKRKTILWSRHPPEEMMESPPAEEQTAFYDLPDEAFDQIENMVAEVKETIAGFHGKNILKDDLTGALRVIVRRYQDLQYSPYQEAINELILSECEKQHITILREEDVIELW